MAWNAYSVKIALVGSALLSLACGKKPSAEQQLPSVTAATPPAVSVAAAAPPVPSRPAAPRVLSHFSPGWGLHGTLPPKVGLRVGTLIPDVAGIDSEGKPLRLRELAKQHAPLVLIFYRGGFCGFASYFLRSIAVQDKAFRDSGAHLVMISPDTPDKMALTKAAQELDWPMLSDADLTIIKAFHLEHTIDDKDISDAARYQMVLPTLADGGRATVTHPAVFVLDAEGKVRFAHADIRSDKLLAYSQILDGVKQAAAAKP